MKTIRFYNMKQNTNDMKELPNHSLVKSHVMTTKLSAKFNFWAHVTAKRILWHCSKFDKICTQHFKVFSMANLLYYFSSLINNWIRGKLVDIFQHPFRFYHWFRFHQTSIPGAVWWTTCGCAIKPIDIKPCKKL